MEMAWEFGNVGRAELILEGQHLEKDKTLWISENAKECHQMPDVSVVCEEKVMEDPEPEEEDRDDDCLEGDGGEFGEEEKDEETQLDDEFLKRLKGVSQSGRLWFSPKRHQ